MSERDKYTWQAEALKEFAEWLCREIPGNSIISDPNWWAPRIFNAVLRALAAQQEPVPPLDGPKCEHGYPLSAPSCQLCGGSPQASAPADHTAADVPNREAGHEETLPSPSAVGVTPALVAHELYVRVASTPQDGSGGFGDFIEIEDAMGNGVSVPNQSGGNGTHLIGPLYSAQAITDLRAEVERAKAQRDEAWQAFTRLRRAYSMVRYPTLTEELRLLYDAADAVAAGKSEGKA